MENKIIDREEISLNQSQAQMITGGWGKDVIEKTVVEKMTYISDGLKVKGFIAYPKDTSKKYPLIIWNRGGFGNRGAIDNFTARGIYGQLAGWGYSVLATQYRGNAGGEGHDEMGGEDVNDILNLIPLAAELPFINNNIMGIEGWSRGGMMTYLALLKNNNFKCAVLSGAITDFRVFYNSLPKEHKLQEKIPDNNKTDDQIKSRTVLDLSDKLPPIPYLLMHGGSDEIVNPLQTIEMAKKLTLRNINYRMIIFEDGDHFLKKDRKEVDDLRRYWFDKYLRAEQ